MRGLLAALVLIGLQAHSLAQDVMFRFSGAPSTDFGAAVAGAGDVNGDQVPDIVVGARGDFNGGPDSGGVVFIYSGSDSALLYEIKGTAANDHFGDAVAAAGDVNRDGFADVIVGATRADTARKGYAQVISGKDGSILWQWVGDYSFDNFGRCVSGGHDVDRDGFPDLLVGSFPNPQNGFVRVFSGQTGAVLYTVRGTHNSFGAAADFSEDLNQDGVPDLLVGDANDAPLGSVSVLSGVDGRLLFKVFGDKEWGLFGVSCAGLGDVNVDGTVDGVGGHFTYSGTSDNQGRVKVFSGSDGALLFADDGQDGGDSFGYAVADAGDLDHDGFADVMASSLKETSGYTFVYSGKFGIDMRRYSSTRNGFGIGLGLVGDLNQDGSDEFVIGAFLDATAAVYSFKKYDASSTSYGVGWPGTLGVPQLTAVTPPYLCTEMTINVGNSLGLDTAAVLFAGTASAELPTAWGGTLLLLPLRAIPLALPATGMTPPIHIPCDASFVGTSIYLQALELDAGAAVGVSFSKGLKLRVGLRKHD